MRRPALPALVVAALAALLLVSPAHAKNAANPTLQALQVLAAGSNTIAGPGLYETKGRTTRIVYEVLTGSGPDVCITVHNSGRGDIEILLSGVKLGESVNRDQTRSQCFGAPDSLELRCQRESGCDGAWRVDRF